MPGLLSSLLSFTAGPGCSLRHSPVRPLFLLSAHLEPARTGPGRRASACQPGRPAAAARGSPSPPRAPPERLGHGAPGSRHLVALIILHPLFKPAHAGARISGTQGSGAE
ncbi:hypothetical protein NDU88_007338 [Pleurodeles waltl]|uniref:Uncharacterized protein n=1 Tax=Pleurodeles waltl TaxID=8319 RepID=A0AAV7VPF4_PLEWA|nr:hypothetical protein NDU88_007338 [Pleurodeles waltl]